MERAMRVCRTSVRRSGIRLPAAAATAFRSPTSRTVALHWRHGGIPSGVGISSAGGTRTPEALLTDLGALFRAQGVTSLSSLSAEWFARADDNISRGLDKVEFKATMEAAGLSMSDVETR
mmetsp:Transcript_51776/g.166706  ORF Transcript_51776/g.166706 Transcript_51776/m.166706 type:complete len:120 (+) Transcript_51776:64-423(+)